VTEPFAQLDGGELAFPVESLEGAKDDGCAAAAGGGLPLAIAAHGDDPGKDFGGDEEVGMFGKSAQKIEGDHAAFADEAGKKTGSDGDGVGRRREAGLAEAGFSKGGRGRGKLRVARQEEAEADVVDPGGGVVQGAQRCRGIRCGSLAPARGARDL